MAASSYRDMLLEQLLGTGAFGQMDQTIAQGRASEGEDEILRGRLGSRRKLREGERLPEGSYASVRNPFTWLAARQAQGGAPASRFGAVDIWSTPQERQVGVDKNRNWGQRQLALWGER